MCFSAAGIENFLIWLVIVCAIIGILKILVPWILSLAGIGITAQIAQIINIIVIAVVIIAVIVVAFALIECVAGGGGFGMRFVR
jgi:hypothetical protein